MTKDDETSFAMQLTALCGCFDKEINDAMIAGYWMALKRLPIESVSRAFERAVEELTYFPQPVELRRMCGEMAPEERSLMAWQSVIDTIGAVGTYTSVDFDDPLINAVIRNLGGWAWLGRVETDEMKWIRKDFDRVYCSLLNAPLSDEALGYLPGISEHTRAAHYEIEAPRVITTGLPPHSSGALKGRTVKRIEAPRGGDSRRVAELVGDVLRGNNTTQGD